MSFKTQHLRHYSCCAGKYRRGGITITSKLNFEENSLEYAVSFCSEKDSFVKKLGTTKSIERLENQSSNYYRKLNLVNKKVNSNYLTSYILYDMLIAMPNKPNWANDYIYKLINYNC